MSKNTAVRAVVTSSNNATEAGTLSSSDVQSFASEITTMATLIGEGRDPMTPIERLHTPRARMKVLSALGTLTTIATEQGLDATSIASVTAKKAYIDLLTPLVSKVDGLARILGDTILSLQSDAWAEARGLYMQLQGKAKTSPILDEALAPMREAFRIPRRAPATSTKSTKTASTSATATEQVANEVAPEATTTATAQQPPHS